MPNKVANTLTKKIGPLKTWQWGLIVAGGALGFRYFKKGSSSSAASSTANADGSYYDAAGNLYDANGNLIQSAPAGSSGGGDYTDAYGNTYDANGNLIQSAPNAAPSGSGTQIPVDSGVPYTLSDGGGYPTSTGANAGVDQSTIDNSQASIDAFESGAQFAGDIYTNAAANTNTPTNSNSSGNTLSSPALLANTKAVKSLTSALNRTKAGTPKKAVTKHAKAAPVSQGGSAHKLTARKPAITAKKVASFAPHDLPLGRAGLNPGGVRKATSVAAVRKAKTPKKTGLR